MKDPFNNSSYNIWIRKWSYKKIVITDSDNKRKFASTSEELAPELIVVDPGVN
jgi:hypothetical protein